MRLYFLMSLKIVLLFIILLILVSLRIIQQSGKILFLAHILCLRIVSRRLLFVHVHLFHHLLNQMIRSSREIIRVDHLLLLFDLFSGSVRNFLLLLLGSRFLVS